MTAEFPQSTRALQAERPRFAMVLGVLLIVLLLGTYLWYFVGVVAVYGDSTSANVTEEGLVEAIFSAEINRQLNNSQTVLILVEDVETGEVNPIPARIVSIGETAQQPTVLLPLENRAQFFDPALAIQQVRVQMENRPIREFINRSSP